MLMITRNRRKQVDQQGFAALVIAFTLVTVLSLLTLGFSQLIRNESKQALNRQLSSQAYYAAEAGVNDAVEAINHGYPGNKTVCGAETNLSLPGAKYLTNTNVDTTSSGTPSPTRTQWTCVLINSLPTSIDYGSIDTVNPTVFTASAVDGSGSPVPITSITVAWQDTTATNTNFKTTAGAVNDAFPVAGSWSAPGVLRLGFTPLSVLSRDALAANTYTAFLYPRAGTPSSVITSNYTNDQTQTGQILDGDCNTANSATYDRYCAVRISLGAPGIAAGTQLFFNLRSIYSKTNAHITVNDGAARLVGAQTIVDSTGKSQDVLKRIQVRVPINARYAYPGFSLDSIDGICKQLSVYPNFASGCGY